MKSCPRCKSNSVNTTQPSVLLAEANTCLTCGWVRYAINPPVRLKASSPFASMKSIAHYDGHSLASNISKEVMVRVEVINKPYRQEKFILICKCPFCAAPMRAARDPRFDKGDKKRTQIQCPNNHIIYMWTDPETANEDYTWQ